MKKILCICFSSTYQRSVIFKNVTLENVNRSEYYKLYASGKAVNSARILAQLEKDCVTTFCPLGEGNYEQFVELAIQDNLNLSYVKIPGLTRECWTLLDRTAKTTTEIVVGEPAFERTKEFIQLEKDILENKLPELIAQNDAVLLAGSRPGVWSKDTYPSIAKACMDAGKIFLADYWAEDLLNTLKICTPSIIKINDEEFCKTFELSPELDANALKEAVCKKSRELKNIFVVTRGTEPTFAANNGEFAQCDTEKVEVVNTTACGDSFNAGFIYEYANTGNYEAALKKGTWCAARNAEREAPGDVL